MIDIENEVFTRIARAIRAAAPDTYVTGEYRRAPARFPCVSIEEANNHPLRRTQSSSSMENHAMVMYEVNIYSNLKTGRKTECRALAKVIDDAFAAMGFDRVMLNPIPNLEDATIYRIVARYEAVADAKNTIYRA